MIEALERLTYSVGNEHDPTDPFGRSELTIEPAGGTRLDHDQHGRHRAWSGRVGPAAVERLWAALARAGFPRVGNQRPVPAGAPLCTLVAGDGEARRAVRLAWREARGLPGYDEAITILDDIIRQLSGEAMGGVPDAPGVVVSDIQRVI
jgi:hypothetical protein